MAAAAQTFGMRRTGNGKVFCVRFYVLFTLCVFVVCLVRGARVYPISESQIRKHGCK